MIYYWFIFGIAFGSFLNVCIYRLPRGESVVFPSSHCPKCGRELLPLDLVPIAGFFLLRGRCRFCGERISFRYPLVELITGLLLAWLWVFVNSSYIDFAFLSLFISFCILVFFIDLERQVVPDAVTIPAIVTGLLYSFIRGNYPFIASLLGLFAGFGLLYAVSMIGKSIFKKEAMGEGDWMIAAFLGAFLGWDKLLLALFLAFMLAGAAAGLLLTTRRSKFGQYLPFGPALVLSGVIAFFWGSQLIAWYLKLVL